MQPYFFPYIGYFQLMSAVDEFVVYDNIEYTKKGWINRNRILVNGRDEFITLPLRKDSDHLNVDQRFLAEIWPQDRRKMLNRITESYRKAPNFGTVYPMVEQCILFEGMNLFNFIFYSLEVIKQFIGIETSLKISSSVPIDSSLRSTERVIALCKARNCDLYLNPIGGLELYDKKDFEKQGVILQFIKTENVSYKQFDNQFVPSLSLIDVLMFNNVEMVKQYLNYSYRLL